MAGSGGDSLIGNFIAELRRRRVIRVIVMYVIAGWIVVQVAATMLPGLRLPDWSVTLVIALVVLGFPIAVFMGWVFDVGPHGIERTAPPAGARPALEAPPQPPPAPAAPVASKAADERRSIAVLPFVNMSGNPENEYFSDGISEEILNLLSKLPQLKVSSRTSSFVFKGKQASIRTVAKELGVSTVLEGSVRRAGDHVRITAQLIDTASDSHLWSETYNREMKDVFAIQDDIARSIAQALQVALGPKERRALQNVATADPQAYDFYLRGRKYVDAFTRRDFLHAITMFERAIELDPNYAMAYAGIADTYAVLHRFGDIAEDNLDRAAQASRRAIELDPESAEAHTAFASVLFSRGDFAGSEKECETAILINPKLYEPYMLYGRACIAHGDFEKAARLLARAMEVDPSQYEAPAFLAMVWRSLGRPEQASAADVKAVAVIEHRLAMNPDDARALCFGASALAAMGQSEKARAWAEASLQSREDEPTFLYNTACTFAQLGDRGRALDLLERAVEVGRRNTAWIENDSDLTALHDEPRFRQLLQRMRASDGARTAGAG